jgi:hypothetical protein
MTRIPPTVDWSAEVPDADVAAEFAPDEPADPEEPETLTPDADAQGPIAESAESGEADPVDVAEQQEAVGNEDDDYSRDE